MIEPDTDLRKGLSLPSIVFLAVPSAYLKQTLERLDATDWTNKLVISAVKGMIPDDNLLIAEFMKRRFNVDEGNLVNISGPSHAEEVAMEKLSYLNMACIREENALIACALLNCSYIRCSVSDDVYGTSYAAVLKNIYAITAGIFNGLGYGDNFHAVLISNCIEEMERFLRAVHPITRDIKDAAYLGDLLVTAYSQFSRNRTLGTMVGKGYAVANALLEMKMVAEGYTASGCIHRINNMARVNMPIAEATYRVLYENGNVREQMQQIIETIH